MDRDTFVARLKDENIGTGIHYRPAHVHSFYRDYYRRSSPRPAQGRPAPHRVERRDGSLSLPLWPGLTEDDQDQVVAAIRTCWRRLDGGLRCAVFDARGPGGPAAPASRRQPRRRPGRPGSRPCRTSAGRLYALGTAQLAGSESDAITRASDRARLEVVARLRATVRGRTSVTTRTSETRQAGAACRRRGAPGARRDERRRPRPRTCPAWWWSGTYTDRPGAHGLCPGLPGPGPGPQRPGGPPGPGPGLPAAGGRRM